MIPCCCDHRHATEGLEQALIDAQTERDMLEARNADLEELRRRVAVLMESVYPADVWLPDDLTPVRADYPGDLGSWMVKRVNAQLARLRA